MTSPKRIRKIRFGLLSPAEIRKMSVTKIITADTYDDDGYPIDMGLMDPRLGVIDPGLTMPDLRRPPGRMPRPLRPHRARRSRHSRGLRPPVT